MPGIQDLRFFKERKAPQTDQLDLKQFHNSEKSVFQTGLLRAIQQQKQSKAK
jgi:hypothetical protein